MDMLLDVPVVPKIRHPAKYTDALLPVFIRFLRGSRRILDPFGGTGKIFDIQPWLPDAQIEAVEIEADYAAMNPRTTLGNALALPWADNYFDAACTSPVYGNRLSDCHNAKDGSRRNTYTHTIGHELQADNAGKLQWGPKYKDFHVKAWTEAKRVLQPNSKFVLNIKDHIRNGQRQFVTDWHIETLCVLGFEMVGHIKIETPSNRQGANGDARLPYESVILFRLEAK
jgi:hypothetical protein